jgi:hypothetical protein
MGAAATRTKCCTISAFDLAKERLFTAFLLSSLLLVPLAVIKLVTFSIVYVSLVCLYVVMCVQTCSDGHFIHPPKVAIHDVDNGRLLTDCNISPVAFHDNNLFTKEHGSEKILDSSMLCVTCVCACIQF